MVYALLQKCVLAVPVHNHHIMIKIYIFKLEYITNFSFRP